MKARYHKAEGRAVGQKHTIAGIDFGLIVRSVGDMTISVGTEANSPRAIEANIGHKELLRHGVPGHIRARDMGTSAMASGRHCKHSHIATANVAKAEAERVFWYLASPHRATEARSSTKLLIC